MFVEHSELLKFASYRMSILIFNLLNCFYMAYPLNMFLLTVVICMVKEFHCVEIYTMLKKCNKSNITFYHTVLICKHINRTSSYLIIW
jgi:hypothetical protein